MYQPELIECILNRQAEIGEFRLGRDAGMVKFFRGGYEDEKLKNKPPANSYIGFTTLKKSSDKQTEPQTQDLTIPQKINKKREAIGLSEFKRKELLRMLKLGGKDWNITRPANLLTK